MDQLFLYCGAIQRKNSSEFKTNVAAGLMGAQGDPDKVKEFIEQ
jgi:hypothetical protein